MAVTLEHATKRSYAKIYREAARIMEEWDGNRLSCNLIAEVAAGSAINRDNDHPAVLCYEELMKPRPHYGAFWLHCTEITEPERRQWRILALCFMAAISERP